MSESQVLRLIADVVSVVRDGHFEWVSPAVTPLLGWTPDDVIGRSLADFVHPDDEALRQHDLPVSPGQVVTGRRVRLRHSDGRMLVGQTVGRLAGDMFVVVLPDLPRYLLDVPR